MEPFIKNDNLMYKIHWIYINFNTYFINLIQLMNKIHLHTQFTLGAFILHNKTVQNVMVMGLCLPAMVVPYLPTTSTLIHGNG